MLRLFILSLIACIFSIVIADTGPSHGKIISCYDISDLKIDVDWNLCTHVIHVDENFMAKIAPWESSTGINTKIKVVKDKYPQLKIIYGIRQTMRRYFEIASNSENRSKFIEQVIGLINQNKFNGLYLDVDFEPSDERIKINQRENFVLLLEELKEKFKRKSLSLSIAIGDDLGALDVAAFSKYPDFVYMSQKQWNNHYRHMINSGLPPNKIVETLSITGTLQVRKFNYGLQVTEKNIFSSDICNLLAKGNWKKSYNSITFNTTATLDENSETKVLVYQSSRSVAARVRDAIRHDLAGIALVTIMDDFEGNCQFDTDTFVDFGFLFEQHSDMQDKSKFYLLRTINYAIIAALNEIGQEAKMIKLQNHEIPNEIGV